MDLDFHLARKRTDEHGVTVYKAKGVIIGYTWTDEQGVFHLYRYPIEEVEATKSILHPPRFRSLSVRLFIIRQVAVLSMGKAM